jgi:hypothetical protein
MFGTLSGGITTDTGYNSDDSDDEHELREELAAAVEAAASPAEKYLRNRIGRVYSNMYVVPRGHHPPQVDPYTDFRINNIVNTVKQYKNYDEYVRNENQKPEKSIMYYIKDYYDLIDHNNSNMINMIRVCDMTVGQKYVVNDVSKELRYITKLSGMNMTNMIREPYYMLEFTDNTSLTRMWDDTFEKVNSGGKRKSKRRYKTKRRHRKPKSKRRKSKQTRY